MDGILLADNRSCRAVSQTDETRLAFLRKDVICDEISTSASGTTLLTDMCLILISEILDGAQHWISGSSTQSAERSILHYLGDLLEKFNISFLAFAATDVIQNDEHLS
jgi:LPS O-antigen subunit length determinant protein (WzzB/FepE family)